MDEFERQLNDLDMQGTMINATMQMGATATPVDEVDSLISQVADEAGLELGEAYVLPPPYPRLGPLSTTVRGSAATGCVVLRELRLLR